MMMPQLPTFSPIYDYCDLIAVVLSARIALKDFTQLFRMTKNGNVDTE